MVEDKRISHYRVLERLGSGGMGEVYLARDTRLGRKVALKFLSRESTRDTEARRRFEREARAAASLSHPNIITVYEIDEHEGRVFMAMEYLEGETLRHLIENPRKEGEPGLPVDRVMNIIGQVCAGLGTAHEAGIVHRDIKPGNIMVTPDGRVVILDFGLAKLKGHSPLTLPASTVGTTAYMSPEQIRGDEVDHRTDIWSLGVTLYEMLAGRRPFCGENDQAVIYAVLNNQPDPLSALCPDPPGWLDLMVRRMMQKDPERRDITIREITEQITRKGSGGKRIRAGWRKALAGSLGLIAFWGALALYRSGLSPNKALSAGPIPLAVIHFENLTGDPANDHLSKVIPRLLVTSLEQSQDLRVVTLEQLKDLNRKPGEKGSKIISREKGFELCRSAKIDALVVGSFTKLGDMVVTDARVMDVSTRESLGSASSRGRGEESILLTQIDELSRKIAGHAGAPAESATETIRPVRDLTTRSWEAYNYYVRGKDELEKLYWAESRKFLEKAVEKDPQFAMAYYDLSFLYAVLGMPDKQRTAIRRAHQLSVHASERERLYIEARYALDIEKNHEKRKRLTKEISEKYPREKKAFYWLGFIHASQRENLKAIEMFNRALALDPHWGYALNMLSYAYAYAGDFPRAYEIAQRYAAACPGDANPMDTHAEIYFIQGRFRESMAKLKDMWALKPDFFGVGAIPYMHGLREDYASALAWLRKRRKAAPTRNNALRLDLVRAFFLFWQGRSDRALEVIEGAEKAMGREVDTRIKRNFILLKACLFFRRGDYGETGACLERLAAALPGDEFFRRDERVFVDLFSGLLNLEANRLDAAREKAAGIKRILERTKSWIDIRDWVGAYIDLYHGEVLLKSGSPARSVAACAKARFSRIPGWVTLFGGIRFVQYNFPFVQDTLARAYLRNDDVAGAIGVYETLTARDRTGKDRRLIYPPFYFRLAGLYQQRGDLRKAVRAYRRFISLWKNCDPHFQPMIRDARKKLKKLTESETETSQRAGI